MSGPPVAHSAPIVALENVSKRFGAVAAVDGLSLAIEPGEFFALLGPSGCGKTTLMRMIAGFDAPDAGVVRIDGADMTGAPPYERPVNMMFQSYALFPHMSVARNIGFGLRRQRLPKREIAARVAEMLRLTQLEGFERRRPHQLSGGQRQRVALARALARRPRLLLLDEPLAALDRKLREETQFELLRVQRETGAAFCLVTHDQEEAMAMASRIGVMREGRLEQVGSPRDIYDRPVSRSVAAFIGEINLFELVAAPGSPPRVALAAAPEVAFDADGGGLAPGATLALRPERLRVEPRGETGAGALAGVVRDVAFRGAAVHLRVALPSGFIVRASLAHNPSDIAFAHGDAVALRFDPRDAWTLSR